MNREPRISILTPTYNHEAYIRDCLESVLSQDYNNWELVVLDDGSTDNTADIVQSYANADHRIRLETQANRGPIHLKDLYNKGLNITTGELVAILEGDDYWPTDKLRTQITCLKPDTVLCYGKCHVVNPYKKLLYTLAAGSAHSNHILNNYPIGQALTPFFKQDNFIPAVTAIIKRSALDRIGGFISGPDMMQVDFSTWCHLSTIGHFQYVDHVLGCWRRHPRSITVTNTRRIAEAKNAFLEHFCNEVLTKTAGMSHLVPQNLQSILQLNLDNHKLYFNEAKNRMAANEFQSASKLLIKAMRHSNNPRQLFKTLLNLTLSLARLNTNSVPLPRLRRL